MSVDRPPPSPSSLDRTPASIEGSLQFWREMRQECMQQLQTVTGFIANKIADSSVELESLSRRVNIASTESKLFELEREIEELDIRRGHLMVCHRQASEEYAFLQEFFQNDVDGNPHSFSDADIEDIECIAVDAINQDVRAYLNILREYS